MMGCPSFGGPLLERTTGEYHLRFFVAGRLKRVLTLLTFTVLLVVVGALAGFVGALTGLGGGIVITPVLTLACGIDIKYAIGASLVATIATSSGSAAAYVRDGLSNIRLGMLLEVGTVSGALFGAYLGTILPTKSLAIVFGLVMLQTAYNSAKGPKELPPGTAGDPLAQSLGLNGEYVTASGKTIPYVVQRVKLGIVLMFGAGAFSGLLGIGSGSLKVPAMDIAMRIPFRVSTATSNFMIGVTAVASAGVYLARGQIEPNITLPIMLGVVVGALVGAWVMPRLPVKILRQVFAVLVAFVAVTMVAKAVVK